LPEFQGLELSAIPDGAIRSALSLSNSWATCLVPLRIWST